MAIMGADGNVHAAALQRKALGDFGLSSCEGD